jgi:Zn-dependent metalloprotease
MFARKLLLLLPLCAGIPAITQIAYAQGSKKSYEVSAFSIYQSLPVNKAASTQYRKLAATDFPGWHVTTDKLNGYCTDIYGTPLSLQGGSNADKAVMCMSDKMTDLGVVAKEWKLVNTAEAPKANYAYYAQVINGHPVVFAKMTFRFTKAGELARVEMKNYGKPSKKSGASISRKEAQKIAVQDLADATVTSTVISNDWSWFPVPVAGGYQLHPAWHFDVAANKQGAVPLLLTGYIDAANGKVLYRTNTVKETSYDVTVKGVVYKDGTSYPATSQVLPNLKLQIGASTFFTDTAGYFASLTLGLPQVTIIPLEGKWSTVVDGPSTTTPSFTDLVGILGTTYTYPATTPGSIRHINAYYHVNKVHDYMKGYFPAFTGMDFSLPTTVDLNSGLCNAYYSGHDINFFVAGGGCNSFAEIGDIVYHEYGHGISDHFYTHFAGTSMHNGALNEACSDVWAMCITHDSVLGRNAFTGGVGFIRRYDLMPQVYPMDLDVSNYADPHKNGQIIAGTWWDAGINLGGVDSMAKLFTQVYFDVPDGPNGTEGAVYQSILIDALMADDDNSNLADGTPHYAQLLAAFTKHGIYLEGDAQLIHEDMPVQPSGEPISIVAGLDISNHAFFHDMTLYYRINGAGAWNPVLMANSSFTLTGVIPAQPDGTVVEYFFILHDSLTIANAYFPITCNPKLTASQATITYQFGVGMHTVINNNFDGAEPGWAIGGNPGDNATTGLWQVGYPSGSVNGIFPLGDHTTHLSQCAITGNGVSDTGVSFGLTTMLTPVFDISAYSVPVIEYYRWFSNEQGYQNFKNDPWIVEIRDAANTSWQTVEKTYQGDDSWRRRMLTVSAYLPSTATGIQMRFSASDYIVPSWARKGQSLTAVSMDDFTIYDKGSNVGVPIVAATIAEIYPNPANNAINIKLSAGNTGTLKVYDLAGKSVATQVLQQNATNYTVDTRGLADGAYNVVIQTEQSIVCRKVVVTHE